ncbi:MAG: lysophospholipid acyltransferase family protein [Schwartzia sp.]|nr:lysophospholipid acyltransferase family protein [Schwartzia sp. (in: firmicutes)]
MISYYFAKLISWLCCLLPAGVCDAVGRFLGNVTWLLVPRKRKVLAKDNIMACLGVGEAEAERIAKASWVRFGPMFFEVMRFPRTKGHLTERVEFEGLDEVRKCLALGRGAVFATSHCGNWELSGAAIAEAGIPLVGVGMRQKDAGFDRFITEYRSLVGMHVTYKDDVREMFTLLKEGWAIGLLMDQDISRRDGVVIKWFGRPTNFVQGPATLARHQDIPIIPFYITQLSDRRHRIIFHPPIPVERTRDKRGDIIRATEAVGRVLEAHIRSHAEEWFWLHDRWKSVRSMEKDGVLEERREKTRATMGEK